MAHTHHTSELHYSHFSAAYPADEPVYRLALATGEVIVRAGALPAAFGDLLRTERVRSWAFLSAVNPHSFALSKEANRQRHETLCRLLEDEGFRYRTAQAVDFDGDTESVLIFDILPGQAEAIAGAFAQTRFLLGDAVRGEIAGCAALDFAI